MVTCCFFTPFPRAFLVGEAKSDTDEVSALSISCLLGPEAHEEDDEEEEEEEEEKGA
jgi:hypothetical protein